MNARRGAWIAASIVALCLALLAADWVIALRRPTDSKIATEQARTTAARLARRTRDNGISWVLIAATAVFLYAAKVAWPDDSRGTGNPARSRLLSGTGERTSARVPPKNQPPEIDLTFVEDAISRLGHSKETTIALLQTIQAQYRYLPDEALRRVCELTEITPAEIAGTSTFYARFRRSPVGEHIVRVCHGTACHVSGARQITDELRRYLAIPEGADTDPGRRFTLDEVACLGCCSLAPVIIVDGRPAGKLTPITACDKLQELV